MRLDSDASNRSQSPLHNYTNGSTRSPESRSKVANGESHPRSESNGSYTNGNSNGPSMPATFFGHDREEVTRILIQSLTDLGYHKAAGSLCKESGFQLEGPTVASFRSAVLKGEWAEAEELLFGTTSYDNGGGINLDGPEGYGKSWTKSGRLTANMRHTGGLKLAEDANRDQMLFWVKQQKYLELLERRDMGKALMVLRQELTPIHQDVGRLHALSSLIMCQSAEDLKSQAQWDGAQGESRSHLLSELSRSISPSVMIPEHRLAVLLDDVKRSWIDNCLYHNTSISPSLYKDHLCERDVFPTKAYTELRSHKDEVWFLKYSNDGTMLASTSKDKTVVIYDATTYKVIHQLVDHESGVTHLAWSPDDTKIITCSAQLDCTARIWDVKTGRCIRCIRDFTYPCTTAAWAPNGKSVVIGSQDRNFACAVWDLEGKMVHNFHGPRDNIRVNDLAISPDGRRLIELVDKRILVYDLASYERLREFYIDEDKCTSVTISKDSERMLVSMNKSMIKLMEIDTGETLQAYDGRKQEEFIIRSSFGGADENFVVSGSEDSRIYIWRMNGQLVETLDGHQEGCVNSVAWHPSNPKTFASAGDDSRIKIWHPVPLKGPDVSNGWNR
ncbi:WD repeat-containing protein-like protein [Pleomassaria siparia CBS 279.74]|uniref:WD repeat-containing protein-like protein n=1 Tax=Pleomassaria siparia CBS 279.74 TaxID=1314801 RepID=A0A6G1JQY0_9PLEO|nr:WD repeat-containing protein-like protein [Pleomassaria siparia CBS 279.74]